MSEASECSTSPTLQEKLAELDSIKPHPYGTFHAVGSSCLICLCMAFFNRYVIGINLTRVIHLTFTS